MQSTNHLTPLETANPAPIARVLAHNGQSTHAEDAYCAGNRAGCRHNGERVLTR